MSWWDGNQKTLDLTPVHCLKVVEDQLEVPTINKLSRVYIPPRLFREIV